MKRCTRCIIPDTVPGITFNDEGLCSLCRNYSPPEYQGKEALVKLVASVKEKGKRYDCVVPISGGRDSSFVLYFAKEILGLKPLAVNFENSFRADQALVNIKNACGRLNVDLELVSSKRDIAHKIVQCEIRHALPRGLIGIIEVLCTACTYGYHSAAYRAAEKYKAPMIIWGSSQMESTLDITSKAFGKIQAKSDRGKPRSKLMNFFRPNYIKLQLYYMLMRIEFHVPGNSIFLDRPITLHNPDIREIGLFDYIPWERKVIKETIMTKLGWDTPPDHVSTWRTDCILHSLVNFCFANPLGCTKACFGYSNMINSGQMTRYEALRQEEAISGVFTEELRELLLDKIGLTKKEVDKIAVMQTVAA